jgi:hypothetical protein
VQSKRYKVPIRKHESFLLRGPMGLLRWCPLAERSFGQGWRRRSGGPAATQLARDREIPVSASTRHESCLEVGAWLGSLQSGQTMSFLRRVDLVAESTPQAETYFSTVPYWLFI